MSSAFESPSTARSSTATTANDRSLLERAAAVPGQRHSAWTIALHWSTVLAVVMAAAAALSRDLTENDAVRTVLMDIHRQMGLFVLLAVALRLIARLAGGMVNMTEGQAVLVRRAAHLAHFGLYALLVVLPLLGLATTQAHAVHISLFGLIKLPMMMEDDADLAETLSDYHVWAAWAMLFMVLAHVAAALWHHLGKRDGVLTAMMPWIKRR